MGQADRDVGIGGDRRFRWETVGGEMWVGLNERRTWRLAFAMIEIAKVIGLRLEISTCNRSALHLMIRRATSERVPE